MSSIKQVKIGDVTYDLDLLASIVEQKLRESQLFTDIQNQVDAAANQAQTVFIFRTTNVDNVSTPIQGQYPPNNWTIVPSPIRYDDDTLYISIGRMHGEEFISWNPNTIKYWTDPLPILGKNAGGSYDPTANMILQYQAYKAASNINETFFYRNTGSIPPEGYSLTNNLTLQSGQKIYVTSARKKGATWLYWEDGKIWSEPVPLIGETTSTTGADTINNNYIYCITSNYVMPDIPSITPEEMEDASSKGYGYGCDGSLRTEKEEVQPEIWFDHPQGVSSTYPYEWVAVSKDGKYLNAVLWAKFGSNGQDGDGVEYIFYNGTKSNYPLLLEPYNGRIGENTVTTYTDVNVNSDIYQNDDFIPTGWHDNPLSPSVENDTVYVSSRKSKWNKQTDKSEWLPFSTPTVWSQYIAPTSLSIKSNDILFGAFSLEVIESVSTDEMRKTPSPAPFINNGWKFIQTDQGIERDQYIWMITAQTENGNYIEDEDGYYWSKPIRITSEPGEGSTSDIAKDDESINFIFTRTTEQTKIPRPTFTIKEVEENESVIEGAFEWFDHPQGVTEEMPFEYISINIKGIWSDPALWAVYGKQGTDGDSVEYIFCAQRKKVDNYSDIIDLSTDYTHKGKNFQDDDFLPKNPQIEDGGEYFAEQEYYKRQFEWMDNPTGISEEFPYQYVSMRKRKGDEWQPFCTPTLWSKYGRDGEAGVVNGYILHCDNDNVFVDDDFFSLAGANFNNIAGATFTLSATDGEDISNIVQYKIQDSKELPSYLTASIDQQGNLTYTVQSGLSKVSTGSYYVVVGAYINERCIATRKQVIQIDDFSANGVSYKLNVYPNTIKVTQDNKLTDVNEITIEILEIGNDVKQLALADIGQFTLVVARYDEHYNEQSITSYNPLDSFKIKLGDEGSDAHNYYIIKLQRNGKNLDVETVNTYKDGKSPSIEQLLDFQVLRYVGNWTSGTYYYDGRVPNEQGIKYTDVVSFAGTKYICISAHTSTSWDETEEQSCWEEMLTLQPAYISQLVAEYLNAQSISVKQITILDNSNNVCGGIVSTSETGDDIRIWMGSSLPGDAPFKVRANGTLEATNANIEGSVKATEFSIMHNDMEAMKFIVSDGTIQDTNGTIYAEGTPLLIVSVIIDGELKQYIFNMTELRSGGSAVSYLFVQPSVPLRSIITAVNNVEVPYVNHINYTLGSAHVLESMPCLKKVANGSVIETIYPTHKVDGKVWLNIPVFTYYPDKPNEPPFDWFNNNDSVYQNAFWVETKENINITVDPRTFNPQWTGTVVFLQKVQFINDHYEAQNLKVYLKMENSDSRYATQYYLKPLNFTVPNIDELISITDGEDLIHILDTDIINGVVSGSFNAYDAYRYITILNLKLNYVGEDLPEFERDNIQNIKNMQDSSIINYNFGWSY